MLTVKWMNVAVNRSKGAANILTCRRKEVQQTRDGRSIRSTDYNYALENCDRHSLRLQLLRR